ncbi:uncharacterized protein [Periplaneta americana]|uniref:uncharacterized protein n=1 Tax=Periplaneta americana TaxID=6978 RepID=UPI0037E83649
MFLLKRRVYGGLLLCWTIMQVVYAVEREDVKVNSESNLANSISKIKTENSKVEELSNIDKEKIEQADKAPNTDMETKSEDSKSEAGDEDPLDQVYRECKNSLSCAEGRMVQLIDQLDVRESVPLLDDHVTLVKSPEAEEKDVPKNDGTSEPGAALLSRIDRYLKSHSIRVEIPEFKNVFPEIPGRLLQERSVDIGLRSLATDDASEGRGRLKKLILPLLLGMKLKASILLPIFISTIALISFKGLWAGLAAMLVSGALGLKALLSNSEGSGGPSTRFTLGFLKPHLVPDVYHSDYLSGWSRSVPLPADHPYRTDPHYRGEHPYRGYYPSSWDRPVAAAAAAQ